jgi:hypothetical protein
MYNQVEASNHSKGEGARRSRLAGAGGTARRSEFARHGAGCLKGDKRAHSD